MRRHCLPLFTALFALLTLVPCATGQERLHVVVLHTNDMHGQVQPRLATWLKDRDPLPVSGGIARVASAIRTTRAKLEAEGAVVFVVDGGDWFQGTPEGRIDEGRPYISAMAAVGYDALAVGNHEFDHGVDVLEAHLGAVRVPALLANATQPDGSSLTGTKPYEVVERGGLRVALIGFCAEDTPSITHASTRALVWRSPAEVLTRIRTELEGQVDWFLPLTHCGVGSDRQLAAAHPDLALIVGGHSHSLLQNGVREGKTLIVQAGSKASLVGRVDLWLDPETKAVLESRAGMIELYEEPAAAQRNPEVDKLCAAMTAKADELMGAVVGSLTADLPRAFDPFTSSPCGNLVTDAMRARTKADVALQNRGGLRTNLLEGKLTRRHLFQLLPFDNHLVTLTLTGAELETLMRTSVESRGGRGLEFSGLIVELTRGEGRPKLAGLIVGGEPLDPEKDYRVTVNSFNADGGDGYTQLAEAERREVDPILLRDLLAEYLDGRAVTPPTERRYRER
ncbi:MAG: bifunctional UDP-sugar hydrolase/5'-nucleotidase [Planctomycetota bacterium]|nr:bifunctional UDP-sugar hydrolase/5'-nucleotidase [Planctomycetota bacterium]